jgi:carboxyl-terminal processing protease
MRETRAGSLDPVPEHSFPESARRMRLRPSLLIPLFLCGCSVLDPYNIIGRVNPPSTQSHTPVPVQDDSWKAAAIEAVWTTVNERYYDPTLNGIDWPAVRSRYEPRILAAKSDDEYWELLDKMTGELRDSHTRVHSPKQVAQQRANESHSLGLGFIELEGALVLTSVHPESDAWWAGARAGMTIRTIDGEPALALYHRLTAEARDSSTAWARTRGAARKINSGDIGTKISMTFVRSDGSEIAVTQARRKFRGGNELTHRVLPSGIGYVRFSGFVDSLEDGILNAIDEMKDTPALILDLRNNGGGSGLMAQHLMAKFFEKNQKGVRLLTRTGKPVSLLFYDIMKIEPELKGAGDKAYTKPLVILTNMGSASASEVVSGTLQDGGRATIIGQRTCGCLLGYLGYADLPGGGQLAYSEIGFVTSKGRRIEGDGVTPDRVVPLTREDYVLNRDRTLEAAEKYLNELAAPVKTTQK